MVEEPQAIKGAKRLGQCCAELPVEAAIWYCMKPGGHDGQHEATVKWAGDPREE